MKNSRSSKLFSLLLAAVLTSSSFVSCSSDDSAENKNENGIVSSILSGFSAVASEEDSSDFYPEASYSDFDLNDSVSENAVFISFDGGNVTTEREIGISDGYITLRDGGDYVLEGSYTGQIVVDSEENVHLILNGLSVESAMAPIYIKSAKNVCITLADRTENTVTDSSGYTYADGEDEPAAALYSKADLTINGNGSLSVTGNYDKGIHSKDDLKIVSGSISVNSVGDAVKGKDCVLVRGGEINIVSGEDGLKSNNDADSDKGYIIIDGGVMNISVGDDGVHSESYLIINGGEINVTKCYEGLESKKIEIYGGDIYVKASDDGINAASGSSGGDMGKTGGFEREPANEAENGRGMNGWESFEGGENSFNGTAPEGEMTAPEMPEGEMSFDRGMKNGGMSSREMPEGEMVPEGEMNPENMPEGEMNPQDENMARGGKANEGGIFGAVKGMLGGMGNEASEDGVYLKICGGRIYVEAGSDSIDSNGTFEMTGGEVTIMGTSMYVYGMPDGIIDTNGSAEIKGGTFVAYARSEGSADSVIDMPYILLTNLGACSKVTVSDSGGQELISLDSVPSCSVVYISSDKLTKGESCIVNADGNITELTAK